MVQSVDTLSHARPATVAASSPFLELSVSVTADNELLASALHNQPYAVEDNDVIGSGREVAGDEDL